MRPQVGKRSSLNKSQPDQQIIKTKARMFVESKTRHNLSVGNDFLLLKDVATAININALEQRMITKKKIINLINKGLPGERIVKLLENEIDDHRHKLVKLGQGK